MTAPAIRLCAVEKSHGGQPILRGCDLDVAEGELVALVGRSGSGKSTLLSIAAGLDRRYTGTVEVFGQDLAKLSDGDLAKLRGASIGLVFQSFQLLDHLDTIENVLLPAHLSPTGVTPALRLRAAEELGRVGMAGLGHRRPSELSGGQRQRVAIARALLLSPKLLLGDEPTGNLDRQTGAEVIALFSELHRSGLTVLLVTHESRVASVATRVVRLEEGRVSDGGVNEATA